MSEETRQRAPLQPLLPIASSSQAFDVPNQPSAVSIPNAKRNIRVVCETCRKKKFKRNGARPCSACNLHRVECTYETKLDIETRSQALKRKYTELEEQKSAFERVYQLLRDRPADESSAILQRIRCGADPESILHQIDHGDLLPISIGFAAAQTVPPANFAANPSVGGGGTQYTDSAHFRIYGAPSAQVNSGLRILEAAYACFVGTLGWRSSGLSYNTASDAGPYYKLNIYAVASLRRAEGQMYSDAKAGLSYLKVIARCIADPIVMVHEYGHALTYHERSWVDQSRTGAWWETVAEFVADTYMTSPICAPARTQNGQSEGGTLIELSKVIGDSHQVLVDATTGSGNYYQAWPFLTYLTTNPDGFPGLGNAVVRDLFRKYKSGSNETPLHTLERIAAPATTVQRIVGRYWARMAYVDIGHPQAAQLFQSSRSRLNYANLDAEGSGAYRVKAARQPKYMGASIIPLKNQGAQVSVKVTAAAPFTATLAVRPAAGGAVRYVDLAGGAGQVNVASSEEVMLVVANTPASLSLYDPFKLSADVLKGLDYQVQISGATVYRARRRRQHRSTT